MLRKAESREESLTLPMAIIDASQSQASSICLDVSERVQTHLKPRLVEIKDIMEMTSDALINLRGDSEDGFELVLKNLAEHKTEIMSAIKSANQGNIVYSNGNIGIRMKKIIKIRRFETRFGTFVLTTTAMKARFIGVEQSCERGEQEHSFLYLLPSSWLISRGFAMRFNFAAWGLSVSFPIQRAIPYGNPAFELCERGDLRGVQRMLSEGTITLFDIEQTEDHVNCPSRGTLLHVCTIYFNP